MPAKKKKKGRAHKATVSNPDTEEELLALAAIYGDEFSKHQDGLGFDLVVVPHPGMLDENLVSVQLSVRYPHHYPAQPVALKLKNPEGLSAEEGHDLLTRLKKSAAEHAEAEEVCAFNLVDMCQELLRAANERRQKGMEQAEPQQGPGAKRQGAATAALASGDQAHGQSLWHSMQRRNGGVGLEDEHRFALERQGSLRGSLVGPEASVLSLGEDLPSMGQVGGLSGGLWGYDDGLYDMDDSVNMDAGLFGTPSPPALQSPTRRTAAAASGLEHAKPGSPELRVEGEVVRIGTQPAKATGSVAVTATDVSPQPGTEVVAGLGATPRNNTPGTTETTAPVPDNGGAAAKPQAVLKPKGRACGSTRPSPFDRQVRASRVPAAVLARRLPRAMRALVSGASGTSIHSGEERTRQRLHRSHINGTSKIAAAGSHARRCQQHRGSSSGSSGTERRDGCTTSSDSSSSGGSDDLHRPKGSQAMVNAGGVGGDADNKRLQPGRLWARGGDSSSSGSSGSSEEGSEDGTESKNGTSSTSEVCLRPRISGGTSGASLQREVSDVRLPLLLGHLLTMAAAGPSLDARGAGLEALCDHLRGQGLLPQWLHWLVTRQPQLFEQAFKRVFNEDMRIAAAAAMADRAGTAAGADSRALMRFWSRQSVAGFPGASGGSGSQRQKPHGGRGQEQLPLGPRGSMAALAASRYLSDFLELRRLGKGGFGVVVAAVNRLDGRQYAVKKIKLDSGSPSSYMRITREVATLSRLQHPNVVRYFQAWCENLPAGFGLDGSEDEDDEDDEFGKYSEEEEAEEEELEDGEVEGGEEVWGFGSSQSSDSYQPPSGQSHIRGPAHGQQHQQQRQGAVLGGFQAGLAARLGPPAHQSPQANHRYSHAHQHHEPAHVRVLAPVREEAGELTSAFGSSVGDLETGSEMSASASASVAGGVAATAEADSGAAQRSGSADTDTTGTHVGPESDSGDLATPPGSLKNVNRTSTPSRFASASAGAGGRGIGGGGYEDSSETNTTATSTTTTTTTVTRTTTTAATATTTITVIGKGTQQQSADQRPRLKGHRRKSSQNSTGGSPTQMLYIQMEFCPRTLAEVLQEGPLQEEDAWRVLRGILAGLAYIHSQGVIHRDLKPANIFYGANGEIKLGDFGLAKFHSNASAEDAAASAGVGTPSGVGAAASAGGAAGTPGTAAAAAGPASGAGGAHSWRVAGGADGTAPSERTGVCGSFFYISPEIKNGWARYDEKVDLWSLGVVAFELWHSFATGMERAVLLNDLRDHARLPEAWEQEHPRVARLIRWLMAPNPRERPSAREVLASDLLPPRVEDEQLKDLLRYLPSNPDATERVVAALFSLTEGQPPGAFSVPTNSGSGGQAATHWPPAAGGSARAPASSSNLDAVGGLAPLPFDGTELPGAPRVQHAQAREDVIRAVRSVFECHGARSFFSNQVGYAYSGLAPDAVRLLSPHGAVLAMRHEMRYPFAVWLVQQLAMEQAAGSLDTLRRYDISYVMRSGRARSLPTSYCQADLDLLHAAGSGGGGHPDKDRLLAEAEAIKAVTQVLDQFLPELGRYEVRVSHRAIERALYDSMGLPPAAAASAGAAAETSGGGAATGSGAGRLREADVAVRRLIATALRASPMLGAVRGELRYKAWPSVKAGLDGFGLPADRVARFKRCVCELPGDVQGALARLKAYLQEASASASAASASAAVAASPGVGGQAMSTATASAVWKVATSPAGHSTPVIKAATATATGMPPSSQPRNAGGGSGGGGSGGSGGGGGAANPATVSSLPSTLALAMEEVAMVVQLLDVWGVPTGQVVLDPLMSPAAEYYSGVFFQVHLLGLPAAPGQQGPGSGGISSGSTPLALLHGALAAQRQVARPASAGMVAVGGRYDALLRALWVTSTAATASATSGQHPHAHGSLAGYAYASLPGAVGATLNVERLITGLSQQRAAMAGAAVYSMGLLRSLEASKADVLVCARGGDGALAQRMALVSALWNAGVRAEMMPRSAPSLSDQYAYAQARGVRAVVILGDRDALSSDVTIKSLDKRSESVVVPLQDAPRQLAAALSAGSSAGRGVAGAVASSVVHAVYSNYGSGVGGKDAAIAALFSVGGGQRQGGTSAGAMFGGGAECKGGTHGGSRSDVPGGGGGGGGGGVHRERDREKERERDRGGGGGRADDGGGGGRRGGTASETDRDRDREHELWDRDRDRESGADRLGTGERERRTADRHHHWGDREQRGRRGKGGGG